MLLNSWPIRVLITRAARAYGFLDPVNLVAKIRGFAQPSEFSEPIELLRAGMLFHARGLVNTKAIQNNLDWVWPFWVERQFNPADESFIPRAFSFSHINLTHRNWTAVGLPNVPYYPIVDPRGLVTPLFDGWSLDFWLVPATGGLLVPSKVRDFRQTLACEDNLHVRSIATWNDFAIETDVSLTLHNAEPQCCVSVRPIGLRDGYLAVALRPYNPEGISFVEKIAVTQDGGGWTVNGRHPVLFDRQPERMVLSVYKDGDAAQRLGEPVTATAVNCGVGMATAVALFRPDAIGEFPLEVRTPIYNELEPKKRPVIATTTAWNDALAPYARLRIGDRLAQRLYDLAVANLVLHSPDEVYPGPYTYKRFWFRDAAFILNAVLSLGDVARTRRALAQFAPRQRSDGYFLSQEGEWDSNGEALWIFHRFITLTGGPAGDGWLDAVEKGARWIIRKRLPADGGGAEAGLLPAGFSAEHLGPNDFYYWDDFWGVAGLRCAAELLREHAPEFAAECSRVADDFLFTIERSFPEGPHRRFPGAIPASPKRRMDSGAVGSLVADYPLQLFSPGDPRILKTADYLRDHSSHDGGFFQNMIHSGINAYLTLHLAQVRLRAGETEAAFRLMDTVAELASPTGQWPEAIHPRTHGGCMGDGEHIWAAAEWALMIRACFLREERDRLVIGPGLREAWWRDGGASFARTLTRFGAVTVQVSPAGNRAAVAVDGIWHGTPPVLDVRIPGYAPQVRTAGAAHETFTLDRQP
ncbi:MAG TPA: hypothetical protein VHE61_11680 [Opitutaceae bacterium]|nr:hypothetical protein [Opitutaceae bacterium]